jgi:zinc transporter 2
MYKLKKAFCVGIFFVSAQGVGAYMAGSIAIAADCAHLASDLMSFVVSMFALYFTTWAPTEKYTFGW